MIQGVTQLTISEDSDLLLYGCSKVVVNAKNKTIKTKTVKGPTIRKITFFVFVFFQVLYKMGNDGDGLLVDLANLPRVRSIRLSSFTMDQFRWMCMLSGCDYLPSIKGMGLIKAFKFLQRHKAVKQVNFFSSSLKSLNFLTRFFSIFF